MKDKITNLKLILKNDRRIWFGAALIAIASVIVLMSNPAPKRSKGIGAGLKYQASDQSLDDNEAYKDLIVAIKNDTEKLTKVVSENRALIGRQKTDRDRDMERSRAIFDKIIDQVEGLTREVENVKKETKEANDPILRKTPNEVPLIAEKAEIFGDFDTAIVEPPPAPPEGPIRTTFISPGDVATVTLMTGVAAPVDGTPYPVMFKIDGPITGPDGSMLDVGEARIIAAAQGSETDARVIYRLTEMALRHKDGRRSVVKVDGWIIDEDGIRGMGGRLKDNLASTLGALTLISSGNALADRFSEKANDIEISNSSEIAIDQNDIDASLALGATDTFKTMSRIIVDRFQNQIPVVEVLSGRKVVAIFSTGTEIEILDPNEDGEDIYSDSSLS